MKDKKKSSSQPPQSQTANKVTESDQNKEVVTIDKVEEELYHIVLVNSMPRVVSADSLDKVKVYIKDAIENKSRLQPGENQHVLVFKGKQLRLTNCIPIIHLETENGEVEAISTFEESDFRTDGLI